MFDCIFLLGIDFVQKNESDMWTSFLFFFGTGDMWTLRHGHTDFCWVLFILCNKDVGGT